MNDAVTATAAAVVAAADHRVAAKCARTNQFNLGNFQVVLSRKNEREEKRKWRLILRRLAIVGPDRGFLNLPTTFASKVRCPQMRVQSAPVVVRDTVNIFDLIAI